MSTEGISRRSTASDILAFLKENHLEEAMDVFEENKVDGDDFFDLEFEDIYQMIPRLKLRKNFIKVWSEITNMTFDHSGDKVARQKTTSSETSPLPPAATSGNGAVTPPSSKEASPDSTPISRASNSQSNSSTSPPAPKKGKLTNEYSSESQSSDHWLKTFVLPSRWEPDVEEGLKKQSLNPSQKNALVRQLCSTIMAEAEKVSSSDRNHIALLLVQKYPFLKGSLE